MSNYLLKTLMFVVCPASIFGGVLVLANYSNSPGPACDVVQSLHLVDCWDFVAHAGSKQVDEMTIVLFYHPHCPCTASSVRCLQRLSYKFSSHPIIRAFAYCPTAEADSWIDSPTTDNINQLPEATVIVDRDGLMCRQFGVRTSGHTLLYDKQGQLEFSGGITPGRGHEGDCLASADLVRRIHGDCEGYSTWPVFGCPILESEVQQP